MRNIDKNKNNVYGIIYCAINTINDKRYIGQTIRSLNRRKKEHISLANNGSEYAFHLAIRKYGEDVFEWSIIDTANNQEELDEKEIYWIDYYDTYGVDGYNMAVGGQFNKKTDENADDLSQMHGGREFLVFDLDGNFIKSCMSQTKFADEIGACTSSVNNVLLGIKGKHSVKGYILIFKDEFNEEKLKNQVNKIKEIHKEFVVFDKNNNFLGKWDNQIQCNKEIGISTKGIQRQLNKDKGREHARKYRVYYIEDIPDDLKQYLFEEVI